VQSVDALGGYIDKRPVQTKTARTSLCTLQRFYRHITSDQAKEEPESKNMIDFGSFNTTLFGILLLLSLDHW
jgi:hypothetical protein